jgi:hypothetical protein
MLSGSQKITTMTTQGKRERHQQQQQQQRPTVELLIDGCNGSIKFQHQHDDQNPNQLKLVALSILNTHQHEKRYQEERLDMIPPLKHLLVSSEPPLFDSVSVIFDGISQSKRPIINTTKKNHRDDNQDDDKEELPCSATSTDTSKIWKVEENLNLYIEITGIYDETDNVIVRRVENYQNHQTQTQQVDLLTDSFQRNLNVSSSSAAATSKRGVGKATSTDSIGITVVRRSELGCGKNRMLLQSMLLQRPHSVLCLYNGFSSQLSQQSDHILEKKLHRNPKVNNNIFDSITVHKFFRDEDKTTTTTTTTTTTAAHAIPIVVTDDGYLRQRVVQHHGYVMSFHQLWILLKETHQKIDTIN